jgi:DNA-directed RNA polymerase specialized sigma24 family protein
MKIKYEFATGKPVEIEVSDEWSEVLIELDRQEYNINHKETRRHTSLDGLDYEGEWFADDTDIDALLIQSELSERMRSAIKSLKPAQQDLINNLYLTNHPLTQAEYSRKLGIAETSVQQNARRAKARLREILESQKIFFKKV